MTDIGIVAAGTYIPQSFITAAEIAERTGIPEHIVIDKFGLRRKSIPGPNDHTNAMAVWAAQNALARALMSDDPDINTVLIAGGYRNGDLIDYANPNTRFLINLAAGGGALVLQRNHPANRVLGSAIVVDGSFSLDVIVPVGGTVAPLTPEALERGQYRFDVPDPEGMKQRLDQRSMETFIEVIDTALARSGYTRADIDVLNILHMKRSAHQYVLHELGLREDQSVYLEEYGHIGQQDQPLVINLALETGHLKPGDLMVMVAAGIGYAWAASVVRWG